MQTLKTEWDPAIALLLCCARTCMTADTAEHIRTLARQPIDWASLVQLALPHGMLPLLYWNLHAVCPEAVPSAILKQLRNFFHANAQRNAFLAEELLTLLTMFQEQGMSAIPLKGPALAAMAYGNLAFRQCGDLDLLVRKPDVLQAKKLLVSQGYWSATCTDEALTEALLHSTYEGSFVRHDGKVIVDLHWGITPKDFPFPLHLDSLWQCLAPVSLPGASVRALAPQDTLLILCVHGAKHFWERLQWICDIAELVRAFPDIDWVRLVKQAQRLGSMRMLALGLLLAHDLLDAPVPPQMLARIEANTLITALAAQIKTYLFSGAERPTKGVGALTFSQGIRGRFRDRVHYAMHLARLADDRERWLLPLPACFSLFYYLLRPLWLLGKSGYRFLKSAC